MGLRGAAGPGRPGSRPDRSLTGAGLLHGGLLDRGFLLHGRFGPTCAAAGGASPTGAGTTVARGSFLGAEIGRAHV